MKTVTNGYKNQIKLLGKEIDSIIRYYNHYQIITENQKYHTSMKYVGPIRKELGRTIGRVLEGYTQVKGFHDLRIVHDEDTTKVSFDVEVAPGKDFDGANKIKFISRYNCRRYLF